MQFFHVNLYYAYFPPLSRAGPKSLRRIFLDLFGNLWYTTDLYDISVFITVKYSDPPPPRKDGSTMWADKSVFYQIYPLGFCGAPKENDGVTVSRIGKIGDWAPHIQKLGAGALYLSPIFDSDRHG